MERVVGSLSSICACFLIESGRSWRDLLGITEEDLGLWVFALKSIERGYVREESFGLFDCSPAFPPGTSCSAFLLIRAPSRSSGLLLQLSKRV